ncbi:MAG: GyrI-like domain-containing protein [Undibacterium sp.]|nr:GyrI-like domain-containing protein [Undibacterium sp.]
MCTQTTQLESFIVSGLLTRTTNQAELLPESAKIGALWSDFFAQNLMQMMPHQSATPKMLGVYANYESDLTGAFDVIAGMAVTQAVEGYASVQIQAGTYQVFEFEGDMPGAVVAAWTDVWAYFASNPQITRRYGSDFEEYRDARSGAIYIGILA